MHITPYSIHLSGDHPTHLVNANKQNAIKRCEELCAKYECDAFLYHGSTLVCVIEYKHLTT